MKLSRMMSAKKRVDSNAVAKWREGGSARKELFKQFMEVGWLVSLWVRLAGWLVGWLLGWLVGFLVGWLAGDSGGWLVGWLVGRSVGWLVCWVDRWVTMWIVGRRRRTSMLWR